MARVKRLAAWVGLAAAGLLLFLVLVLGLGYGYLQSDGGRDRVAKELERLISKPGEVEVRIGRLTGQLPFAVSISDVRISDAAGPWLAIEKLGYDVDPAALFDATLKFRFLEANRVRLDRLPEAVPTDESEAAEPGWPTLPLAIWLERFTVGEVALGPAVLGQPASFRVDGEATSGDGSDVDAALTLVRSDGAPGSARATFRYVFAERYLDVDARVEEPEGGLIVRALELERLPALEARLTGRGPLSDWNGELALTLENFTQANAKLQLRGQETMDFSIMGSLDTAADFEELPWRLLHGHLAFETVGRWRAPSTLVLESASVTSPAVDLSLSGIVDLDDETLEAKATAQLRDPEVLRPYLPDVAVTDLRLTLDSHGRFDAPEIAAKATAAQLALKDFEAQGVAVDAKADGPLSQPRLSLDLKVDRLSAAAAAAADDLAATATFAPGTGFDWDQPRGKITSSGTIGRLDVAALRDWSPAIGQDLAWNLEAEVDPAGGQIRDAALSLETAHARVAGQGSFAWESGATDAKLQFSYPDLAPLGTILGQALEGGLEASAEITSAGPLGALDAKVAGSLNDLVLPDPLAQGLVAPTLEFGGQVALDRSGAISVTALRLASPTATVTGDVDLDAELTSLTATYRVALADLAVLSPAIGQPVSGSAVVDGRASGSVGNLDVIGNLEIPKGSVAALAVKDFRVEFSASGLPARPSGRLSARLTSPVGEVTASTRYAIAEDAVDLTALSLAANDLTAEGSARVPMAGGPVTLRLDGRVESLSRWLALAGLEADGKGPFELALQPDGARQAGRLETTLTDARLVLAPDESVTAGELKATIDGTDLLGSARAETRLAARNLALADLDLATVEIEATGGAAGGDYRVTAAGSWFGDLRVDTAGRVAIDGERIQVEVSRLTGHAFEQDLALKQPAQFAVDGASMAVSGLDLTFGEARLQAAARRAPDQLSADVTVKDLPVAALRPLVDLPLAEGRGDASLRVSGPIEAPQGDLTVEIRGVKIADIREVPPVDLSLTGRWQDGRLASSGRLTGLSDEDVVLTLDLPLRLDPESLVPVVPTDGPLAGELTWQGPIDPLWELVPADLHELSGLGDVRASVGGTVGQPNLGGAFELSEGRYESLEAGTLLRKLELAGDLSGDRIQLTRLSATDGGKGSLEASGALVVEPDRGFSADLEAKFKTFAVLRRDDITAVAGGDISVTGSPGESLIKGQIETDSVEVNIPDRLPPDVVNLNVEIAGAPPPDSANAVDQTAKPDAHRMTFDITINIPRRAFIRGRGIDSEWAGTLKVSGTDDKMVIKGKLNLVRGQVSALGKTFRLDEGSVTFLGTAANDPTLKIVARRKTDDLDVTITVSGPLSNPKLAFSSAPELPEDELISRVLFGKTTAQLTAIEAAQLAASVAELTGRGGGAGGILGRIRSSLGVDVLRVESSETGDSATPDVAAGKYLTDDVYIGAKQGATAESGAAEIEVELTPNISIESSVGQQGQSEVGVNFKWDY